MKKIVSIFISIIIFYTSYSQEQANSIPISYRDSSGTLFWNLKLPVFLSISSGPGGKTEQLSAQNEFSNPYYFEKEGENSFNTLGATHNQSGKVNTQVNIQFKVIVDGTSPLSKANFLHAASGSNSKAKYYGPGLNVRLSAKDSYSGVKQIFYSINGQNYQIYNTELSFLSQGDFLLKYYAEDNVGNIEAENEIYFRVDNTIPETKHSIVGEYLPELETLSERSSIELIAQDTSAELAYTLYQLNNQAFIKYPGKPIPVKNLSNGFHTLRYFSVDNVQNQEDTNIYEFYVDRVPPILTSDVLGDRFVVNNQVYFSGRTKFKLICVDNKAGIDSLKYSIDNASFENYTEAFYLPRIPGYHLVSYYAKDRFGNTTRSESWENTQYQSFGYNVEKIYIDLVGPGIMAKFTGFYYFVNDTVLLGKDASIELFGQDNESGMQYMSYSLDGIKEETKYTDPIKVYTHGKHQLEYFGYDNVNNRDIGHLFFYADYNPPSIQYYFSVEPNGKKENLLEYPSNVALYLAASDEQVGTKIIEFSLNKGTRKTYLDAIKDFNAGEKNSIRIYATDNLNNISEKEIEFFVRKK